MRLWWVLLAACGAQPQLPPVTPAPVTDADPEPYTPPVSDVAVTGAPVGIRSTGASEQARSLAVRLLEALVRGDEQTLSHLLSAEVAIRRPGRRRLASRHDVIARALRPPRRRPLGASESLSTFVDLGSLRVQSLSEFLSLHAEELRPDDEMLRPDDWVVTFTFTPRGRRTMFLLVEGWRHRGAVIVRTGQPPQVVGL